MAETWAEKRNTPKSKLSFKTTKYGIEVKYWSILSNSWKTDYAEKVPDKEQATMNDAERKAIADAAVKSKKIGDSYED